MTRRLLLIGCLWLLPVGIGVGSASTVELTAPPGFLAAVGEADKKPRDCPAHIPPFTETLDFPSRYEGSDSARDDLNEKAQAEYRRRIADITRLERTLSKQVDHYIATGHPPALACIKTLLGEWAGADALMGESVTHTGMSMRKWALGTIASSYLRLKASASRPLACDPAFTRRVEDWIGRLAERVVEEWRDRPLRKMNNHEYWAAWSVMASAVVLDRRDLFDWAMSQYRIAMGQIDAEGYLPNELARDTRALYYHNYALNPLAMMAAFAKANGIDLSSEDGEPVQRLARRVLAGVDRPVIFEDKTGKTQNLGDFTSDSKFAWLEPYCWTFGCDPRWQARLSDLRPLKTYRLGGDVTMIFGHRDRGGRPKPLCRG